jgi:hypothetical protein
MELMSPRLICIWAAIGLSLAMGACEEEPVRTYTVPGVPSGPSPAPPDGPAAAPAPLSHETPPGWREAPDPTGMRRISYEAGAGDAVVTITAMALPASAFDLDANLRRWAGEGQAELPDPTDADLHAAVGAFESDHPDALRIALDGPVTAVHVVTVPRGARVWFFKMIGPTAQVAAERERFDAFVRSVQFNPPAAP